jgi:hypothetical protein
MQSSLFPHLGEQLDDPVTEKLLQCVTVLEIVRIEEQSMFSGRQHMGRKRMDRRYIARAFVVKAVYDIPTTEALVERVRFDRSLRRVCGWERRDHVPSLSTFSRAFEEFAGCDLGERAHAALVQTHLGERIVGHVSRDSTEIDAREKRVKKPKTEPQKRYGRGRPKKGEEREVARRGERLKKQTGLTAQEAIAALPKVCDVGTKTDSKGHSRHWVGWKLHIDSADGGLPITALLTSASMHDSQAAIPMAKRTAERVTALYELMDSAYDADLIHETVRSLGHVPIIDIHPRRKNAVPFDPAMQRRYNERSTAERVNARLKDEFGGRHLRVRGHSKAHLHLMFGLVALFADQLLKLHTG